MLRDLLRNFQSLESSLSNSLSVQVMVRHCHFQLPQSSPGVRGNPTEETFKGVVGTAAPPGLKKTIWSVIWDYGVMGRRGNEKSSEGKLRWAWPELPIKFSVPPE